MKEQPAEDQGKDEQRKLGESSETTPDSIDQNEMFNELYESLHQIADSWWRDQTPSHTLQPTALIHEAYLKLAQSGVVANDMDHFRAIAAIAMRQILVDHARKKARLKRGGGDQSGHRVTLSGISQRTSLDPIEVLEIHEAIEKLHSLNPRHARIVEMRCFADMKIDEIARVLDVSDRTIRTEWRLVQAWMRQTLLINS
ncbi:MAG: ECF-type sigma factor [Phycisphaerales bacterium]